VEQGQCDCRGGICDLDTDMATAAFRIVQECLTNVARHAQAKQVLVLLKCIDDRLMLRYQIDGKGVAVSQESNRHPMALSECAERAHGLGGTMNFFEHSRQGYLA